MRLTRSEFLKACGMAVAAPAVDLEWLPWSATGAATGLAGATLRPPGEISAGGFRNFIHQTFHIGPSAVRAHLVDVADGPLHERVVQYSLIFTCDAALEDGIYRFSQAELGTFDLFIAPIGAPSASAMRYQACISQMVTR